jgi:3-deoxy-D-manno-octulosonate 8-phosphate phosphatase KdsC-like HAD superfamily phosphatase
MTQKRKRIKLTISKALLIKIIETAKDGQSLDDRINELLVKGFYKGQNSKQ